MLRFSKITISAEVKQINELNCSGSCNAEVAVKFGDVCIDYEQGDKFYETENFQEESTFRILC